MARTASKPPASDGVTPVEAGRFAADLGRLWPEGGRLGLAVSGGPDSLTLLLLAHAAIPGSFSVATVNHGLRAEAAEECAMVEQVCGERGISCTVLTIAVGAGNVQAAAREARYAALAAWAEHEGLSALVTAHHADDQAETLLMRLARGAGLSGLAGIRPIRPIDEADPDGPKLLRPLLDWRKAELEAIVAAAGIEPARDPSNHDTRFGRTAARALLATTPWLDPLRVAASASHLRDAEEALDTLAKRFFAQSCRTEGSDVLLSPGDAPRDILRRALILLFSRHFQASSDGPGLARLMATLRAGGTATLADVMATGGVTWRFRPAPPRRSA
jgi:tRNA(Ile)-lysidine synthase